MQLTVVLRLGRCACSVERKRFAGGVYTPGAVQLSAILS